MVRFLESLGHVTVAIIELVMKLAPLGRLLPDLLASRRASASTCW